MTPRMIQAEVHNDTVKPCVKTRPAIELFDVCKRPQKRVLRQIFCRLGIPREIKGDMKSFLHIPAHKDFKVMPLALLAQGGQLFVAEFLWVNHLRYAPRNFLPVTNL
jgi:hypothetical protein